MRRRAERVRLAHGGALRETHSQSGIQQQAQPGPVNANAERQPWRSANQVASGGAMIASKLSPIWLNALPSALSSGEQVLVQGLADCGHAARLGRAEHRAAPPSPGRPLTNPVATPASDHKPTPALMPRLRPKRSMSRPASGEETA